MKLLFALLLFITGQRISAETINFIDNDWDKARAEAGKQNKLLFVDAYTDWCGWCKVMDKKTFSQDSVAEFMNKNFVLLKLEMEHNYGIRVAMKYRVSSFPSYLVFSADGQLVYRLTGYMEAGKFLEKMREVLRPEKQRSFPGISNRVELDFPDFHVRAYDVSGKRSSPDSATLHSYLDQQNDLFTEVNYSVLSRFSHLLADKYRLHLLEQQDKYATLYGRPETDDLISNFAFGELKKALKDSSEAQLQKTMTFIDRYVRDEPEQTKRFYQIHFYKSTGNWKKFAEQVDAHLKKNADENEQTINGWAWEVYEKASDKAVVAKAVEWMKPVVEKKPQYYSLDTYAALLYKSGRWKDAETYAKKAIDLGKQEGEKTDETEELLKKIKSRK